MKCLLLYLALIVNTFYLNAQEIVITDNGDSVVLYSNGTWDYYENYMNKQEELLNIPFNNDNFQKPASAKRKMTLADGAFEIWFNDKDWKRIPAGELNEEADYALKLIQGDVYGMLIYEELEIPEENLIQIALENALPAAPDMRIVKQEYRVVNGDSLVLMQMDGNVQGMDISYYSYYLSNENGTLQFHTFTGQKLLKKYLSQVEDLLNGVMVQRED